VINTAINGLDPSDLGQIEIHVSEAWAERLKEQPLQGVADGYPVITADGLSDGDVRLVVNNAQVEDLIAERIEQLAQQMNNADFTDVAEAAAFAEVENESAQPTVRAALEDSVDGEHASLDATDATDAVFEELPPVDAESDEE
jgi:regulator of RNase E activity RraB